MKSPGLVALLLIWLVLALAGPGRLSRLPRLCLINRVTNSECPGCGITRGLAHLARGEVAAATHRNVFTLPVAALGALALVKAGSRRRKTPPPATS